MIQDGDRDLQWKVARDLFLECLEHVHEQVGQEQRGLLPGRAFAPQRAAGVGKPGCAASAALETLSDRDRTRPGAFRAVTDQLRDPFDPAAPEQVEPVRLAAGDVAQKRSEDGARGGRIETSA
jgi:hypothetical protein